MNESSRRCRRSHQEWVELVWEWKASGLSGVAFAQKRGLAPSSLYYWGRHSERDGDDERGARFESVAILGEAVPPHPSSSQGLELLTRSGRVIRVGRDVDARALSIVLEVAERC